LSCQLEVSIILIKSHDWNLWHRWLVWSNWEKICPLFSDIIQYWFQLVVPVTFGHSWLRHSSHSERTMVLTNIVWVSEPAVCTLKLSVRVFTPLLDVKKPKTPVLTFWTLVPKSFGNFWKHVPLYNRWFFR